MACESRRMRERHRPLNSPQTMVSSRPPRKYSAGKDGALPDWTSRLTTDGQRPGASFFVPDSFALHGIGLSAGLSGRDAYQRPWRPYLDLSLTHHSQLGVGHAFTVGASGRLTGADQLQLQFSTTRAGSSGDARSFGVRYVRPF